MSQVDKGVSDYRNPQQTTSTDPNEVSTQNSPPKSYSAALSQHQFPSKEQAIIFSSIDGIKLQEYIYGLGSIIGPRNILFSSRISNSRICIYLASKEIVNKFMDQHGAIRINDQTVSARRLVTPADRLVISNVCPTIPHQVLETELTALGLKLLSPITFLRIGVLNPEYSHIFSFRRQVYINPTENTSIPDSLLISYDDTSYRIFLSQDGLSCFKCNQLGHIASKCPNNSKEPNDETPQAESCLYQEPTATSSNIVSSLHEQNISNQSSSKRTITEILTPPIEQNPANKSDDIFVKPEMRQSKKSKQLTPTKDDTHTTEELLRPTKNFIISHNPPFILNYEQLVDLFENTYGSAQPANIALNYTTDLDSLCKMLQEIYPHFTERNIKVRCTKLKKKLQKYLDINPSDMESDSSQDLF